MCHGNVNHVTGCQGASGLREVSCHISEGGCKEASRAMHRRSWIFHFTWRTLVCRLAFNTPLGLGLLNARATALLSWRTRRRTYRCPCCHDTARAVLCHLLGRLFSPWGMLPTNTEIFCPLGSSRHRLFLWFWRSELERLPRTREFSAGNPSLPWSEWARTPTQPSGGSFSCLIPALSELSSQQYQCVFHCAK